jgi:hypothetical protein
MIFNTLSIAKSFTLDSDEMIVDIMYGWWAAYYVHDAWFL